MSWTARRATEAVAVFVAVGVLILCGLEVGCRFLDPSLEKMWSSAEARHRTALAEICPAGTPRRNHPERRFSGKRQQFIMGQNFVDYPHIEEFPGT